MYPFSVVIVCKNEADIIGTTLQSLQGLTTDIVVYDNGSTDGTQEIVKKFPVNLHEGSWEGFGRTKTKAINLASNDWILSLDADEGISEELTKNLLQWVPDNERTVYEIAFRNFLGKKYLRFGEWGSDYHIRLFNRQYVKWDEAPVHENLVLPPGTVVKRIEGHILHRTMKDMADYRNKMSNYAILGAEKYYRQGKRSSWYKRWLSPAFSFMKYYIFKGGFLDGKSGYTTARMTAWYTHIKYAKLKELYTKQKQSD